MKGWHLRLHFTGEDTRGLKVHVVTSPKVAFLYLDPSFSDSFEYAPAHFISTVMETGAKVREVEVGKCQSCKGSLGEISRHLKPRAVLRYLSPYTPGRKQNGCGGSIVLTAEV